VVGSLAVAAFATAARGLLPGVLRDLRSRYPDLSVSLSEREPHEAIPDLRRGHLDIAVVQDWAEDVLAVPDGLSRRDLMADRFDAALPVDHPLAGRDRVAVKELAADDWIGWSAGQICHDWLVRTLRATGAEPRIVHTASEHSTQLALVAAGAGCAVIPRLGRGAAVRRRDGTFDPVRARAAARRWMGGSTRARVSAVRRGHRIAATRWS
jgi:DNA-binding transcriptional LysR family regulator